MPKISQLVEIQEGALDSASLFVVVDNNSTLKIPFGKLLNNVEGLLDISNITFDNTVSGLIASDLKGAIDEISAKFGTISMDYNDLENTPDLNSLNPIKYWDLISTLNVADYTVFFGDLGNDIFLNTMYGGNMFRSTDGGETWTEVIDKDTSGGWLGGCLINENKDILVLGYAKVFKSTDLGATWTETALPNFTVCGFFAYNQNEDTVIVRHSVTPGNNIYRTDDFGETWTEIEVSEVDAGDSRVIYMGNDIFWIRTPQGNWYKSLDDGLTWANFTPESYVSYIYIYLSPNKDYVITKDYGEDTRVYKTTDGGETWTEVLSGSYLNGHIGFATNEIVFHPNRNNPSFFYSLDSGDNWTLYDYSALSTQTRIVTGGYQLSNGDIIAWGAYENNGPPLISKDNCATWELMTEIGLEDDFSCDYVHVTGSDDIYMCEYRPDPLSANVSHKFYKRKDKFDIKIPFANITDVPTPVDRAYLKRKDDGSGYEWITGVSGTFTSSDGKTVTVTDGLITSIYW